MSSFATDRAPRPASASDLLVFFFRPIGRIGRAEFVLAIGAILSLEVAAIAHLYRHDDVSPGVAFLMTLVAVPLLVAELVVAAKRCHDVGLPGLFVVLLLVPLLGLGWLILLAGMPGSAAPNAYGAPPRIAPD
jgi:uncharacterized membrane protein YhaH (DUF805 family)